MSTTPVFGKKIEAAEGRKLMDHFWQIKATAAPLIATALAGQEKHVIRYYCGRPDQDPLEEDIAYVFTNEVLVEMMEEAKKNHGLVLFNSARFAEKDSTDVSGRPTLVIFPFKFVEPLSGTTVKIAIDTPAGSSAYEHPGTGTKPSGSIMSAEPIKVDVHPLKAL